MTPEQDRKECEEIAKGCFIVFSEIEHRRVVEALLAERKKRREKISEEEWRYLVTTKTILLENALEAERKNVRGLEKEVKELRDPHSLGKIAQDYVNVGKMEEEITFLRKQLKEAREKG